MLFIAFHSRRGLSEFSEITSANYLYFSYTGDIDVCNENDLDVCEICAMFVRDCAEGFYPSLFPELSMELVVFCCLPRA